MAFLIGLAVFICILLPPYALVIFSLLLGSWGVLNSPINLVRYNYLSVIVIPILLLYFYGIALGFANGNPVQYILNNTTGMVCIVSFFFFSSRKLTFDFKALVILCSGLIFALIVAFAFLFIVTGNLEALSFFYTFLSATGGTAESVRIFSPSLFASFFFILPCMYEPRYVLKIFLRAPKLVVWQSRALRSLSFLLLISLIFAVNTKSSPLIILLLLINSVLFSSRFLAISSSFANSPLIFMLSGFLLFFVLFLAFSILSRTDLIINPFFADFSGNNERLFQLSSFSDYFSLFGKGSGSPLPPNLVRDVTAPYGTEISFFGALHVYGIMSLLFLGLFVFLCFPSLFLSGKFFLLKNGDINSSYFRLTSLCCLLAVSIFFVLGLGNPVLFTPIVWFYFGASVGLCTSAIPRSS